MRVDVIPAAVHERINAIRTKDFMWDVGVPCSTGNGDLRRNDSLLCLNTMSTVLLVQPAGAQDSVRSSVPVVLGIATGVGVS